MGEEVVGRPGAHGLDRTKLVVDVRGLGLTGFAAADWLYSQRSINLELADHRRILAVLTIGDTQSSVTRLLDGLRDLAAWAREQHARCTVQIPPQRELLTCSAVTPREAFFKPAESVPLDDAVGRVAAEMISPYPPGIPLFANGEVITAPMVECLRILAEAGMYAPDASDPSYQSIRVLTQGR